MCEQHANAAKGLREGRMLIQASGVTAEPSRRHDSAQECNAPSGNLTAVAQQHTASPQLLTPGGLQHKHKESNRPKAAFLPSMQQALYATISSIAVLRTSHQVIGSNSRAQHNPMLIAAHQRMSVIQHPQQIACEEQRGSVVVHSLP